MKKGRGKAKGSGFERQIAKDVVKAFKRFGITQRECWRSINSGGHVIAAGDLEMSDRLMELFPYVVECKFRKKIRWQNFMLSGNNEEKCWLRQASQAAKKLKNMTPILVMKENFGPIYVMFAGERNWSPALRRWSEFLRYTVDEARER